MRSQIVFCLLVGLVYATNPGWKDTTEYVYKVLGRSLASIDESSNQHSGIFLRANLRVQPRPDGKLQAVITEPQYCQIHSQLPEGWKSQISESELTWKTLGLSSKPFQIEMKDGVIVDLVVSKDVQNWEANFIKSIVSQFQMNTKAKNPVKTEVGFNSLPTADGNSAVFATMEDTVTGNTRTLYEIRPLAPHVLQDKYSTLRFAQSLRENEQVIEVVKHKNYNESVELPSYFYGFREMGEQFNEEMVSNKMGNFFVRDSTSWAILTGDLNRYTIQHSLTVNKIFIKPTLSEKQMGSVVSVMNVTLEEVRSQDQRIQEVLEPVHLGNLVYTYEKVNSPSNKVYAKKHYEAQQQWEIDSSEEYQRTTNMGRARRSAEDIERDLEFSSHSEESYKEAQPQMHEAPASPLLPFTTGFDGMSIKHTVNIVEEVQKLARQIGDDLADKKKSNHEEALSRFTTLASLIRLMDAEELQKAASDLYSNAEEGPKRATWTAFRDSVAESGTGPAFLTILKWIESSKIRDEEASQVVSTMSNAVRQPTIHYMRHFFELIKKPEVQREWPLNDTALLGYTELIRRVYSDKLSSRTQYPVKSFVNFRTKEGIKFVREEVIPYLTEKLNEAISETNTNKIHAYIRALGNIADPKILSAFEPYLEGHKQASQFQRLLMILSLDKLAECYPKEARSVLYKVYQNSGESQEVRVAAVYQLMRTSPPTEMLQVMASYTNTDANDHVNAAVKSSIEYACKLDWPYQSLRDAAQAAKPLLTRKVFGIHEGANYLRSYVNEELEISFKQTAQHIGSEDGSYLKGFRYSLRSGLSGLKRRLVNVQAYISSVDELIHVFAKQTERYQEKEQQQKMHADEQQQHPWSSQYIAHLLNMKATEREQLEGYLNLEFGAPYKMFSFDNMTIEQLPEVIRKIEEELQQGKRINFFKLVNDKEMALSFPTEIGLPFLYTYDSPMLVKIQGKLSAQSSPSISQKGKIYKPDNVQIQGDVEITVSSKTQGRISFTAPFEHQQYIAGFDKQFEVHFPLHAKAEIDLKNAEMKMEFQPEKVQRDTLVLHYSTKPYTSRADLKNFEPLSRQANTKYIKSETLNRFEKVYGQKKLGMAFRVKAEHERRFIDRELLQKFLGQEGIYGGMKSLWADAEIQYGHFDVHFMPQKSFARNIVLRIGAQQKYTPQPEQESSGKWRFDERSTSAERQQSLINKVSEGIKNVKAQSVDASLEFLGEKNVKYFLTGAYGKSNVDPKSRVMIFWKRTSDDQEMKPYEGKLISKSYIPNTNGLDLEYSLHEEPMAETEMEIGFGPSDDSLHMIELKFKHYRSEERKQYLRNLPLYQECQQQMRRGNKQLPACLNMTLQANLLDRVSMKVKYENFRSQWIDAMRSAEYGFIWNYFPSIEIFEPQSSVEQNEFLIQGHFHPDLKFVNVSFETTKIGSKIRDIPVSELAKQMFVIHPVFHATDRVMSEVFGVQTYRPACVVDQTEVNTFSNWSYPIEISRHWTLLLQYIPKEARHQERTVEEQLRSQLVNQAVLIRQNQESSRHRDVKITLSAPQTEFKVVDIEMTPNQNQGSSEPKARVTVNGKQVRISDKASHDVAKGYIQIYALPNGEVKVEITNGFYVIYDGERVRVNMVNSQYRGAVRGICGQYNDQKSEEFLTSEDCYARDSRKFVKSLELEGQEGQQFRREFAGRNQHCVERRVPLFVDVISDADAHRQVSSDRHQQGKCTHFKTRYVQENGNICFTLRALPVCSSSCHPRGYVTQNVPMHCIQKSNVAQLWKDQIDRGASPDFSGKKEHKSITMTVPQSCSQ
ncbi:unnamed protein product [Phaedon cochleariae]|uniref:Vitellogenin n=1 Tax=Phaedon cochleariae TaxID=80249 RepID=A0A9P0GLA3_PHACE|nr:unnamed protein product [Phaedon cochleariae]